MSKMLRVGVFMPAFKWERMNLNQVTPEKHGIELVPVELGDDLSSFDAIIHKFTYQLVDGHEADVAKIQEYAKSRPGFVVIEPIDNIKVFIDRLELQNFIEANPLPDCIEYIKGYPVTDGFVPEKVGLNYPLLLKPVAACGTSNSHSIQVIHNEEQLRAVGNPYPMLAFPFIPHHGVVFKCYSLGENFVMHKSKSLVLKTQDKVVFDSQKPLPTEIDAGAVPDSSSSFEPTNEELKASSEALRKMTGVQLIGYDLLRRESDGKLCLVDFNYFPCFRGIEDVPGKFATFIKQRIAEAK